MKLKHLLQLMILGGMILYTGLLHAQQTDRFRGSLVISEFSMSSMYDSYIEVANVGDTAILLDKIKLVGLSTGTQITDVWDDSKWWAGNSNNWFFLNAGKPNKYLQPGEAITIQNAYDATGRWPGDVECDYNSSYIMRAEVQDLADILLNDQENEWAACGGTDIVTTYHDVGRTGNTNPVFKIYYTNIGSNSRIFYLEQHLANGDSVIIDQVNGTFDSANGSSGSAGTGWDVAGVEKASKRHILVRKLNVKQGNLNFVGAAGVGADDSEWMVIMTPQGLQRRRDAQWIYGNHVNAVLDENTLEPKDEYSNAFDVDFNNKKITVPWGVRRLDDVMRYMKRKPGIAWYYNLNEISEDSIYASARTGDKLTIYVTGTKLHVDTFEIVVNEPTSDVNIVIPKNGVNQLGSMAFPRVTQYPHYPYLPNKAHLEKPAGVDTISGGAFWQGIPYATRTDTLLKYLEKPANADWEIVWVDGIARPDLKNGDKLKVIAENGNVKEYFIKVAALSPSHNATLSSITWPDIPVNMKGVFGWKGDTIPGFSKSTYNYDLALPHDLDGFPALVYKTDNLNAKVDVTRATSFSGTTEMRTVTFNVTAADGITKHIYKVILEKETATQNIQPFYAEPFISELNQHTGGENGFLEIVNPGNQPLDLSNYMIVRFPNTNPADIVRALSGSDRDTWLRRYHKYVPGYKWFDEANWTVTPGILEQDVNVNPIVMGGDVFVLGVVTQDSRFQTVLNSDPDYVWNALVQTDVQFNNYDGVVMNYRNPWGEEIRKQSNPLQNGYNATDCIFLFKIDNDSVRLGLKPAYDPNDFEVIDAWGMPDGTAWNLGALVGTQFVYATAIRNPEIWKGNPFLGGSFGQSGNENDSLEWYTIDRVMLRSLGSSGSSQYFDSGNDIGSHYFNKPTFYKSTITAVVYKVSPGYGRNGQVEEIIGITTGTSVSQFLSNLYKADEGQSLTVKSVTGGSALSMDALLSMNDTLVVLSADSTNITKYRLNVLEVGLSSNAVLTSDLYDIKIESEPKSAGADDNAGTGFVAGFEYGTLLRTIVNNVTVPEGATMTIIDENGAYVPLKNLNADTVYVNITVHSNIYFEVVAEDGVTSIIYRLKPSTSESEAFLLSNVYLVAQKDNLVKSVPWGIYAQMLLSNLIPSEGATMRVIDKMGFDKIEGSIAVDDKVVVTSANGQVQRVYHLSMLSTEDIPSTTYLAYVLSDVYSVDQVDYIIAGPSGSTLLTDFYSRIFPSMGATAVVVDANGNEKTEGDLDDGDMLEVTSVDGKIVVMYELALDLTSVGQLKGQQISIYPNPTTDILNVTGIDKGNRIQVYNVTGAVIRDIKAQSNHEVISLVDQASGLYLIVISNDNRVLGRYKAIKNKK